MTNFTTVSIYIVGIIISLLVASPIKSTAEDADEVIVVEELKDQAVEHRNQAPQELEESEESEEPKESAKANLQTDGSFYDVTYDDATNYEETTEYTDQNQQYTHTQNPDEYYEPPDPYYPEHQDLDTDLGREPPRDLLSDMDIDGDMEDGEAMKFTLASAGNAGFFESPFKSSILIGYRATSHLMMALSKADKLDRPPSLGLIGIAVLVDSMVYMGYSYDMQNSKHSFDFKLKVDTYIGSSVAGVSTIFPIGYAPWGVGILDTSYEYSLGSPERNYAITVPALIGPLPFLFDDDFMMIVEPYFGVMIESKNNITAEYQKKGSKAPALGIRSRFYIREYVHLMFGYRADINIRTPDPQGESNDDTICLGDRHNFNVHFELTKLAGPIGYLFTDFEYNMYADDRFADQIRLDLGYGVVW